MRKAAWGALGVSLLAATGIARAQVVKVELRNAAPGEIARELQRALGAPVEVRGGVGRTVTLTLATGSPVLTLDRVAAQLSGTWRMKLRVRPGRTSEQPARPVLERNLAIGMRDLAALRAFGVIARELGADLEAEGAEGALAMPVTVAPVSQPASALLDRIAEQAGASWSIRYVIDAPNAPPPPEPREMELTVPTAPVAPSPVAPRPLPRPITVPLTATGFRNALNSDLHQLLKADPSRRAAAVREFVAAGERRVASLATLSASERRTRIQAARPLLVHWRRMYQGLAPEVQRELRPAAAFLERALG